MIIHFHYSLVANSGDVKRISNIDKEFAGFYHDSTIEVVFFPFKKIKEIKKLVPFTLSEFTKKKYLIPRFRLGFVLNNFYQSLILGLFCLFYHPRVLIGEMAFPNHLVRFVKKLCPSTIIIADIHGAAVDEYQYLNPNIEKKRLKHIQITDQYTTQSADYVICQSDEMKRYLTTRYNVCPEKILVFRCGYDSSLFVYDRSLRNQTRQELGVDSDAVLFVYSGGLHRWQKIEDSLRLFSSFHHLHPTAKMLMLTGDSAQLTETLSKEEFASIQDAVVTRSVTFQEVPTYLNACDIAFLIRDNHTMNAVASPTKLAEYLACGLPVISSEVSRYWVTPDAEQYLLMYDKASILQDIDNSLSSVDRETIAQYALHHFSLSIDRKNLTAFLNKREERKK